MKLKTKPSDNSEKPMNTLKFTENEELYYEYDNDGGFVQRTDVQAEHEYHDTEYNSNGDTEERYTDSQSLVAFSMA